MKPKTLDQIFTGRRRRQLHIFARFDGSSHDMLTAYLVHPPNTLGQYTAIPVFWANDRWERSQLAKPFAVSGSRAVYIVK